MIYGVIYDPVNEGILFTCQSPFYPWIDGEKGNPVNGVTRTFLKNGTIVENLGRMNHSRDTIVWRVLFGPYRGWMTDVTDYYFRPLSPLETLAIGASR